MAFAVWIVSLVGGWPACQAGTPCPQHLAALPAILLLCAALPHAGSPTPRPSAQWEGLWRNLQKWGRLLQRVNLDFGTDTGMAELQDIGECRKMVPSQPFTRILYYPGFAVSCGRHQHSLLLPAAGRSSTLRFVPPCPG